MEELKKINIDVRDYYLNYDDTVIIENEELELYFTNEQINQIRGIFELSYLIEKIIQLKLKTKPTAPTNYFQVDNENLLIQANNYLLFDCIRETQKLIK